MFTKEPVRVSQSTYRLILWAVAVALLVLFGFYAYIIEHAELLQEDWGWIMIVGGVLFFVAEFYLIRFFLRRNTLVNPSGTDA